MDKCYYRDFSDLQDKLAERIEWTEEEKTHWQLQNKQLTLDELREWTKCERRYDVDEYDLYFNTMPFDAARRLWNAAWTDLAKLQDNQIAMDHRARNLQIQQEHELKIFQRQQAAARLALKSEQEKLKNAESQILPYLNVFTNKVRKTALSLLSADAIQIPHPSPSRPSDSPAIKSYVPLPNRGRGRGRGFLRSTSAPPMFSDEIRPTLRAAPSHSKDTLMETQEDSWVDHTETAYRRPMRSPTLLTKLESFDREIVVQAFLTATIKRTFSINMSISTKYNYVGADLAMKLPMSTSRQGRLKIPITRMEDIINHRVLSIRNIDTYVECDITFAGHTPSATIKFQAVRLLLMPSRYNMFFASMRLQLGREFLANAAVDISVPPQPRSLQLCNNVHTLEVPWDWRQDLTNLRIRNPELSSLQNIRDPADFRPV